ncbi:MAG: hypothetical protein HY347_12890 [candidate division NC10 bacterium]|nr:hypothetical protein [candidate division NC10 bacterium]
MEKCRVFVLYEHALFGHGLASIFRREGLEVVGLAEKGEEAFNQIRALKPDVVTVEGEGGKRVLEENPGVRVVSVSLEEKRATITSGELVILMAPQDLLRAIAGALEEEAEGRHAGTSTAEDLVASFHQRFGCFTCLTPVEDGRPV